MDLLTTISAIPGIGPYLPYATVAVTLCATVATALPAPAGQTGAYAAVYRFVNLVALNFGHAKNTTTQGTTP